MRQKLGEMLIEAGAIDQAQLKVALADQRRWGRPLGKTLVELRLIREEDLVRVLGRQLGLESVDLEKIEIEERVIALVPAHLARQHTIVPFAAPMKFIDIAMVDPTNLGVIDEIRIRTQLNVRAYLAGPRMIEAAIERYYGSSTRWSGEISIPIVTEMPVKTERDSVSLTAAEVHSAPLFEDGLVPSGRRGKTTPPPAIGLPFENRDREIDALQERLEALQAVVERDEAVLRKLLALLIEKGIATRDEIVERLG